MSLKNDVEHLLLLGRLLKDMSSTCGGIYRRTIQDMVYLFRDDTSFKYINTKIRYENSICMSLDGKICSLNYNDNFRTVVFRVYSEFGGTTFKRIDEIEVIE